MFNHVIIIVTKLAKFKNVFMRKAQAIKITLTSLLLLFSVLTCSNSIYAETANGNAKDYLPGLQQIIDRGKLVVAVPNVKYSKLFYRDKDGNLQGYYIEVAKKIAQQLGVKVEFNVDAPSFDEVVNLLAQKKADVAICHLSKTVERAKKVLYTETTSALPQTFLINRAWLSANKLANVGNNDAIKILQRDKLKITIGVGVAGAYVDYARKIAPFAIIKEYQAKDLFAALNKEEVDAILDDDLYVKEQMLNQENVDLRFMMVTLSSHLDLIAMAVHGGKRDLLDWLNLYIDKNNLKQNAEGLLRQMYPQE